MAIDSGSLRRFTVFVMVLIFSGPVLESETRNLVSTLKNRLELGSGYSCRRKKSETVLDKRNSKMFSPVRNLEQV